MKTIINGQEYEVLRPGVYVLYQNGKERMRVWNVGEIIADRRKQLHISQDQLAEAVGLNRSTISRYESGIAKKIPHDVAEAIATTLNCTVDYLNSHASYLLGNNVPPVAVKDRLGHSTLSQTLSTYAHLMRKPHDAMIATIDELRKIEKV